MFVFFSPSCIWMGICIRTRTETVRDWVHPGQIATDICCFGHFGEISGKMSKWAHWSHWPHRLKKELHHYSSLHCCEMVGLTVRGKRTKIDVSEPDLSSFQLPTFFFLVTTCGLLYPQCNSSARSCVTDLSALRLWRLMLPRASRLKQRWGETWEGRVNSLLSSIFKLVVFNAAHLTLFEVYSQTL